MTDNHRKFYCMTRYKVPGSGHEIGEVFGRNLPLTIDDARRACEILNETHPQDEHWIENESGEAIKA